MAIPVAAIIGVIARFYFNYIFDNSKNGKKINSQTLKLPSGKILKGKERELFETSKIKLDVLKSEKIIGLN